MQYRPDFNEWTCDLIGKPLDVKDRLPGNSGRQAIGRKKADL